MECGVYFYFMIILSFFPAPVLDDNPTKSKKTSTKDKLKKRPPAGAVADNMSYLAPSLMLVSQARPTFAREGTAGELCIYKLCPITLYNAVQSRYSILSHDTWHMTHYITIWVAIMILKTVILLVILQIFYMYVNMNYSDAILYCQTVDRGR